ncbi:MAG: metalloprotease TldD [Acidobacteria bacterium]|nr:metalloprotease TldD [Acidobacteriota bacterium]
MNAKADTFFENQYGITPRDIERLLEIGLTRGGEFAELYLEFRENDNLFLEESIIKNATKSVTQGIGLRVISGEKTGFACSDDLTFARMAEAAKAASFIASHGQSSRPAAASPPLPNPRDLYPIDEPILNAEMAAKLQLIQEADGVARACDPRIKEVRVSLANESKIILVANSEGTYVVDVQPLSRLNVNCIARDNGNQQVGTHGGGGRVAMDFFREHPPEYYARQAARQAILQLEATEAPAGQMEVVMASGWPGVLLHEAIGHGLEADFNRKGFSAYSGRMGERVAADVCTVVDDGTIPYRRGSLNVDDEGTPTHRTVLIENGVLCGYMFDRLSARLMGAHSTGNGRREDFASVPIPRMTNTFLLAGSADPEEILRSVKRGLYVVSLSGGQVDITNGKFVFSTSEAYLIENGKVTKPVRGATLVGNGPDVLTKVTMVGHDLNLDEGIGTCGKDGQSVPVGVGTPTIKISEMTVGGTQS